MDPSTLQTPAERANYIAHLMMSGDWLASSRWTQTLAAKWNVEVSTVRNYTRLASIILESDRDELNMLRRTLANKFLAIADDALMERNIITGLKDYASAIKALERYAKYVGIDAVLDAPATQQMQTVRVILSDGHQTESSTVDNPPTNNQ